MRKKLLFTLFVGLLLSTNLWSLTWESGDCDVTLDGNTLTISKKAGDGNGAMAFYSTATGQPWNESKSSIYTVVVEEGVTNINQNCLAGIANLTTVTLPSTLTTISNYAFYNCHKLENITLPENVAGTLGSSAFKGCSKITSMDIPAGVTRIGDYAFEDCSGLTSVSLPDNLTQINTYAFHNCTALTSITLPSKGALAIKNSAFEASGLTSITIPANVTFSSTIQYWFKDCTSLSSVTLPSTWTSLPKNAFQGCTALTGITLPSALTQIPNGLFDGCTNLASITIPSGVTRINSLAFHDCSSLTTITLPSGVTRIDTNPFNGCANLETMYFTSSTPPTTLTSTAFANCPKLKIYCPDANGQAYANKFFTVSDDYWDILYLTTSGEHAPSPYASGTTGALSWEVTGDNTLTISGTGATDNYELDDKAPWAPYNKAIAHVVIPEGVTKIGKCAFVGLERVKTFRIPSTVTSIGIDAFFGCQNPEAEVYIDADPSSLTWTDGDCDDFLAYVHGPWLTSTLYVQATKCYVPSEYLAGYKAKWATGSTGVDGTDVNVFFASKLWDGETKAGIEKILDDTDGQEVPVVTVTRPMNRDGYFATLCFPFDLSAAQIAESSLHGAEIKEFTNATVDGGTLNIEFSLVDHIEAGKPYFIKFTDPELKGDALDRLDFMEVTIDKTAPTPVTHGGLTMTGTYVPKAVEAQTDASDGEGVLFLGANNTLYWPNKAGTIKPFRAYFSITGGGPAHIRRGMPAQIVENDDPEGISNTNTEKIAVKAIQNGMLIIEKNGVRYNAQGQIVK